MLFDGVSHQLPDVDPVETNEWLDAFDDIVDVRGRNRARYLLMRLLERARQKYVDFPATVSTPYVNTIPSDDEPEFPGDEYLERRIRAFIRWNAAVMVVRANIRSEAIGGHLSTYASSAALYEVGFNHFFRGKDDGFAGDQVYFQGTRRRASTPRAFVEGRLGEEQLDNFRFEVGGNGLSSYPHPRLMPEFWEYPTVSMGLGPVNAIAQAHVSRYLHARGIADTSASRVWCFVGDGELDEPESLGSLGTAGREHLDNLTFVVNCNLQRLDGPVRGNGKVIQEFEALFRGAGLERDQGDLGPDLGRAPGEGRRRCPARQDELDGRRRVPEVRDRVGRLHPRALLRTGPASRRAGRAPLRRGTAIPPPWRARLPQALRRVQGGDRAHRRADGHPRQDGQGMDARAGDRSPQRDPSDQEDDQAAVARPPRSPLPPRGDPREPRSTPTCRRTTDPRPTSPPRATWPNAVARSADRCRAGWCGPRPSPPAEATFADLLAGSGKQAASTTMAFARLLRSLVRDPGVGARIVPIVADEARTFGLESLIAEVQIYAPDGQRYTPVDADLALHYAESATGQVLEEGITEAGAVATFTAAATSYATWGEHLIPCYLVYSMFGFQRSGDLFWALADVRGRGFLLGCTAGRTTLNGEGLQHQDGHSLLLASVIPSVAAYDPAFAYEVAIVVEDGIRRMTGPEPEDRYWYLTLYNENYPMPALPDDPPEALRIRKGVVAGLYRFLPPDGADPPDRASRPVGSGRQRATLLFSGTAWQAALDARHELAERWGVDAEAWSATSYKALREDALSAERWNRLHPEGPVRTPYVTECLGQSEGPIVAVTDFLRAVPDQIARWVPRRFVSLGTDGFGRSDTRDVLRRFFETDAAHVVVAVLRCLADDGAVPSSLVSEAIHHYGIDPATDDPWSDRTG